MNVSMQDDFLSNVNRMFDSNALNKAQISEEQREKFVNRAIELKHLGIDITEGSKITSNFTKAFLCDVPMSVDDHEKWIEDLSRKYAEMRDGLTERYKDDEDEYYRQMDKLNLAFEGALKSTCLMPMCAPEHELRVSYTEEERTRNEAELAELSKRNKNVQDVMRNFYDSMIKHMDTFYESFIKSIRENDFDTAFAESMSVLKDSETKSNSEISYNDMLRIKDVINNVPTEFDEEGKPTKMRYNSADESFRALIRDESISYSVRKSIAKLFNFYIKPEQETDETT